MSVRGKGFVGLRVVSTERVFDEASGFSTVITYEGFQAEVDSAMGLLAGQPGLRMGSRQVNGPWYRFTVSYAGTEDGTQEGPVDKWSRDTEFAQVDIRQNVRVLELVSEVAEPGGAEFYLNASVHEIKEALKGGIGTLAEFNEEYGNPDAIQVSLFRLYARGAEASEEKRYVVRRRRVIPIEFSQPVVVNAVEVVYTTAQLINTFQIPPAFAALLPANPSFVPADSMWGWRERANTTEFVPSTNKIEETLEWTFAAWSTILYNLIG